MKRSIPGLKDARGVFLKPEAFKLNKFLFDKQLKFVEDPRPYKIAVCSRRAGKTVACAAHLIDTALNNPDTVSLYITLSRNNAKKLIWREMQKIVKNYALIVNEDQTELSMAFENGSIIYCSGAKDESEIEKFRGLALKMVYIDECQSFRPYIEELINDVLAPALMDHAGSLILIGTPGPVPAGYFAEVAGEVQEKLNVSAHWSHHAWTFFDNPFLPALKLGVTHEQMLERELRRRGSNILDPSIQREFFGKWVLDSNSLWVRYNGTLNNYQELPVITPAKWNYIMGIDLGFEDADAIAILAWSEKDPNIYLVEEKIVNQQGLTELVNQIELLNKKYNCDKLVIDEGGLGKKLAEEMRRRHNIPVQPADKARKQENVAFLNDCLRTGRFKAKSSSRFAQDAMLVEIDRSKSTPDKIKVSDKYHSDIIDSVLYAFKESPAFTYEAVQKEPVYGSKEWADQQESDMFEQELAKLQEEAQFNRRITGEEY
jgi:Phage terminase large subunit/Terminase RNaseH-like domain